MAYTEADYAAARDWATGKTGSDIFSKAGELGLSQADLAQVFGANANQVLASTGYGSGPNGNADPYSGVRKDADQWTYNGGNDGGGDWSYAAKPPMQQAQQGGAGVNLQAYQKNPYLDQMAAGITQQATRNLNENILPGVRSQALAAGGFGGSRQGIAEGLAMGRTNDALTNSLSNLYGTDFNNQMNRNLQQYGMDQQYALGQGQLGLGFAGLNNQLNIAGMNNDTQRYSTDMNNSTQRYGTDKSYDLGLTNAANNRYGTDKSYEVGMANAAASSANAAANQTSAAGNLALAQDRFGFESALTLQDRMMGYNNLGLSAAGQIQNTPMNYWNQFSQGANSLGQGYGTTTQSGGGNPLMGVLGGAQLGSQVANWWGGQKPSNGTDFMFNSNLGMAD